ncbi:MAG: hypothetical protein AB8F78_17755 [Saprospiraceae bacterium]
MIYGSKYKKKGHSATNLGQISLQETLNAVRNHKPKFVLFSGGGNDIVGNEVLGYLNHKRSKPDNLVNKSIFEARLIEMKKAIEFFINAVHRTSKKSNIIMDGYDYAKINGKGYSFLFAKNLAGPWLLPSLAMKGITAKKDQHAIVKYFIDEFNNMLSELDAKYPHFHHLDLRGKFPLDAQWDNEIHLKNAGYKEVATLYHDKIVSILHENPVVKFHSEIIV